MGSTAPKQTWSMGALQTPTDDNTVADVLAALQAGIAAHPSWRVTASGLSLNPQEMWLECAPVNNSPLSAMRVLFAVGVNAANIHAPHGSTTNVCYIGIAPDGGTLGNPLGSANPYGSARFSGFLKCTGVITGAAGNVNSLVIVACNEILGAFFYEDDVDKWRGAVAGAIIDPPTDGDGEQSAPDQPGRLFGLMVSGSDNISTTFYQNTAQFTSSGTSQNGPIVACFKPGQPGEFVNLSRADNSNTPGAPRYTTVAGTRISTPVLMHLKASPFNAVGVLRQMRKCQDGRTRQTITTNANPPVIQSFYVGGQSNVDCDVVSFDNG